MAEDKTEQPTAKRLEDARKKGQMTRTKEAGQAASLVAATVALGWIGQTFIGRLSAAVTLGIQRVGEKATAPMDAAEVTQTAVSAVMMAGIIVAPVALTSVITVMAFHIAQGGWNFAPEAIHMNWGKLNPANGFKRFGLSTGGIELLRTGIAGTVIAWLAYSLVTTYLPESITLARMAPKDAGAYLWDAVAGLIRQVAMALMILAGADYLVQRYQMRKSLKMTKQEVKDEFKNSEGNPEIKGRVRRVQREMLKRRMLSNAKRATVVITNPTHYAVALEYRRESMAAPIVVAKGQDHLALRIKAIARENGIPTVENVQLARALYASAEVGEVIPGPLFEAVAEVLAYVY